MQSKTVEFAYQVRHAHEFVLYCCWIITYPTERYVRQICVVALFFFQALLS